MHSLLFKETGAYKKFIIRVMLLLFFASIKTTQSFSFAVIKPLAYENINEVKIPGYYRAAVFVKMSVKEFAVATGQKFNFLQRMYFKAVQRKVKRQLKHNPGLLITDYLDSKTGKFTFNLLWFIVAAFVGPFGILAAYTSSTNPNDGIPRKNKIISAWLGFGIFIIWFGYLFVF